MANVEDVVIRMRGVAALLQTMSDSDVVVPDTDLALGLLAEEVGNCAKVITEEFQKVVNGTL